MYHLEIYERYGGYYHSFAASYMLGVVAINDARVLARLIPAQWSIRVIYISPDGAKRTIADVFSTAEERK